MSTWPTVTVPTTNVDEGTDSPALSRADILDAINKLNQMIQAYAQADGVCDLDATGKVPNARLNLGDGAGIDADTVDGIHAATTATANKLLALDAGGKLVADVTGDVTGNADTATYATSAGSTSLNVIGQSQLKTSTGTVVTSSSGEDLILPGGEYGFYPRIWGNTTMGAILANSVNTATPITNISIFTLSGTSGILYASQRYIQASPPYKIGDIGWGHFLFLLRSKSTGEVRSAYEAQDPPWAYNGPMHLHKDDPELLATIPHPFPEYQGPEGEAKLINENLEIVLVDMRDMDVNLWMYDNLGLGKQSILEDLQNVVPLGKTKLHTDVGIPEIAGFTDKIKIKARS